MYRLICSMLLTFAAFISANAQNPYLPLWEFIPDGEPYVFEDPDNPGKYRVYIYGSHDMLRQYYCGKDQVAWSAPVDNLDNWRFDGVVFESKYDRDGKPLFANGDGDVLYAPDVLETRDKDGRKVYYLYPNVQSDERGTMVAKAYRPDGPFKVCNWSKKDPRKTEGCFSFDPAAFVDDDGRAYGYWGFMRSHGAEIDTETMSSVKPGTEIVVDMIPHKDMDKTFRFFEASSIRKIKDKYVFIYSRWTNDDEDGLPQSNYTLAYCYGNNPLGPWTYGGTIIDGRGKERRSDGTSMPTATPFGNTHGSLCEINGKWWVFYHRQSGTNEYSRQAMVAPVNVEVTEGKDGYVRISEAEFTSEGFHTEGLDPYREYAAGIACYYTGPTVARHKYPDVFFSGSHTSPYRIDSISANDGTGQSLYQEACKMQNPYNPSVNRCAMVNNTDGSVVGYKYFNFSRTYGKKDLKLHLDLQRDDTDGRIDIYLDRPSEKDGGVLIGSLNVNKSTRNTKVNVEPLRHYNGKHSLFLVFSSATKGKSICTIHTLRFE